MLGELTLGFADGARWRSRSQRRGGVYLGAPAVISSRRSFLRGQRRLLVGVVLCAGEHAPEQDRELAGGRDDRFAVPAPSADSLVERVQRSWLMTAVQAASTSAHRAEAIRAWRSARCARARPGLSDLGIEPEVRHQLAAGQEPARVPDRGEERRGADQVHARTVISRRISGQDSACWAISRSTAAISASRNSTGGSRVDRLALLERQLQASEPRPAFDAEQVRARRLALQPALQHRVDLVLARVRECTSCSRRASRRRRIRQRSSGIHTASSSPRHNNLASVRASSLSVFARASDPGVIRADHDHPVHVRLEDPRDLPAAARHLQRHPIRRQQTRRQRLQPLRRARHPPAERTTPSSQIATTQKSRCTSKPIARPTQLTTPPPHLHTTLTRGRTSGTNDTDRYELEAQSRQVAGAAEQKARARSPSSKTAYPTAFSQQSPCPSQPDPRPSPGQEPPTAFSSPERTHYGTYGTLWRPAPKWGLVSRDRAGQQAHRSLAVTEATGRAARQPDRSYWSSCGLSADVGRAPVWACPVRGPLLDQRLPTFRRGARRAATGGRA